MHRALLLGYGGPHISMVVVVLITPLGKADWGFSLVPLHCSCSEWMRLFVQAAMKPCPFSHPLPPVNWTLKGELPQRLEAPHCLPNQLWYHQAAGRVP